MIAVSGLRMVAELIIMLNLNMTYKLNKLYFMRIQDKVYQNSVLIVKWEIIMKYFIAWLLGVPLGVLILVYLITHLF